MIKNWKKSTSRLKSGMIWKNEKIGRWVGVTIKLRDTGKYRAYTIKNGYITHGDFLKKKDAERQMRRFMRLR